MFRFIALACALSLAILAPVAAQAQPAPPTAAGQAAPADLEGDWSGPIEVSGHALRLIFHVRATAGQASTLDSPDQGAADIPVSSVSEDGAKVRFEVKVAGVVYEAQRSADGATLEGQWLQGGAKYPVTLKRGPLTVAAAPRRPQTPQKPYPYREEEVAYENTAQHVHLAGTLTLPQGKGPFPVALLITGSGQQDRDETLLGHKPFLVLSDYLTRRGIAVLRVDDRGMGQSTGVFATATSADFATDVRAGVAYLKSRPDIDPKRVGLIGHSEGGLIGPMVAADDPSIAFVVMMAGPGVDGGKILLFQVENGLKTAGMKPADAELRVAINRQVFAILKSDVDDATALRQVTDVLVANAAILGATPEALRANARGSSGPWLRWFVRYEPVPTLQRVRCPVLAIGGSKDIQVPTAMNLPPIREALKNDRDATVIELPGLNHLFQTAGTGQFDEYAKIEETISPVALKTVGDWVVAHTQGHEAP